jgi:predicted DNA-binding transcriptional regulator AlpA
MKEIQKLAFSIAEFCRAHSIGRSTFYELKNDDRAPQMMKVGKRSLISAEAAAAWRLQMQQTAAAVG